MTPDPRWLEILKASGWQTAALAIACGLIIVMIRFGLVPTDGSPYWIAIPTIGGVVFGRLALASIVSTIVRTLQPRVLRWRRLRAERRSAREYIAHMTPKEREIIGYLLHHNQKVFQADQDGGYAAPLISKGIVRIAGQRGQVMDLTRIPFEIPDHIWSELASNRSAFEYTPPRGKEPESFPWAVHWMAR